MSTRPQLSSAMTRIKAHMMTQIIRLIQLFYFYVSLIQLSGGVWPLCAHEGWWPLMRFSVVGTDVLIFSLFWLQPGDGDGDGTGFTPRPKRSLKLKPSRGRMKRANQSKNQQPLSCKYCWETFTYSSKPIRLSVGQTQRSRFNVLSDSGLSIPAKPGCTLAASLSLFFNLSH